jgi:hypothetical protein
MIASLRRLDSYKMALQRLFHWSVTHRQTYTDGRTLPRHFEQPAWLGHSAGTSTRIEFTNRIQEAPWKP